MLLRCPLQRRYTRTAVTYTLYTELQSYRDFILKRPLQRHDADTFVTETLYLDSCYSDVIMRRLLQIYYNKTPVADTL